MCVGVQQGQRGHQNPWNWSTSTDYCELPCRYCVIKPSPLSRAVSSLIEGPSPAPSEHS